MNKNPFLPQSSYAPSQPPLPPGPPPPPAPAHDYAAYWARNAAAPQNNAYNVNPGGPTQWISAQAPRPPPPPTPEQSALYANYGYGPQSQNAWQRQQQQQQQQPPPQQFQPPPPPAPPPGYNPYQPYSPYVPQVQPPIGYQQQQQHAHPPPMHMPPQPLMFSAPQMMQQQQQQHMPMAPMAPQQMMHQQQQGQARHHSHGNLPPAKRQRFDGPQQGQGRMQPQQLQQQPTMPMSMVNASNRSGPMANSMNMQRGGAPARGMARGRGGSNMNMGGHRGGRGGGGLGRNGSGFVGPGGGNRGGGGGRGGAGGGTFGATNNRRGGGAGNSSGSFTYRGGPRGQNYGNNRQNQNLKSHDGHGLARQVGSVSSIGSFAKKEERKRTLTDFRIVGLEICELDWRWGVVKEAQKVKEEEVSEIPTVPPEEHGDKDATQPAPDDGDTSQPTIPTSEDVTSQSQSQTQTQDNDADIADSVNGKTESPSTVTAVSTSESLSSTATVVAPALQSDEHPSIPSKPASADPPARIRIYFHTPIVAEETMISATRKGKRKKVDEDDEDTDTEERRPPPGPRALMHDDRSSMAPTVGSEPDWLMDAFAGGAGEVEGEGEDDDEEEVGKQLNPDPEPEGATEMDVETDNEMDYTQSGLPAVEVPVQGVENAVTVPGIQSEVNVDVDMHDGPSHVEEISDVPHEIAAPVVEGKNETPEGHEHGHDGAADAVSPAGDDHDSASSTPSHANLENPGPDDIEGAPTVPSSPQEESLQLPTEPPMSQEPETSQEPAEPIISHDPATVTQGDADETEVPGLDLAASTLAALLMAQSEPPIHDPLHLVDTASEQSHAAAPLPPPAPEKQVPPASPNRLSISFARRRLVLDADVVESLRVFRKEGKVEVRVRIEPSLLEAGDVASSDGGDFKGILVEGEASPTEADDTTSEHADSATGLVDPTIPPLTSLFSSPSSNPSDASSSKQPPVTVTLVAYLDKSNPLSEARWVRTGDIREWVRSMCGGGKKQDANREESEGWEGKISVEDPDPPPTIHTILSNWASTSTVGTQVERERFVKTHMSEEDNLLEILLRLVRGERATANYNHASAPLTVGGGADPLLSTDSRQTHVSLAVLAIYRMAGDYAERALGNADGGEEGEARGRGQGKKEVAARIGEMIRTVIPMHLIHKSLEGMFKEWRMERRGR